MFIGTCSAPQPVPGFTNPLQIDAAQVDSENDYFGYMVDDIYVRGTFDNVPAGNNAWRWNTCLSTVRLLCGGDLNDPVDGGDPNDPYVVIEICEDSPVYGVISPWVFVDDISIAIY